MKSTLHSTIWKATLLGSQQVLALPLSYYMVVAQLEGHGLVDIRVVIQRPEDDSELGNAAENQATTQLAFGSWRDTQSTNHRLAAPVV
jgi:hypothetical protein